MANFEKTLLLTGEPRGEYIARRLAEGASVKTVHAEINAIELYSGPAGREWPTSVVYAAKRKAPAQRASADPKPVVEEPPDDSAAPVEVPEEYQGILDAEDMAEIRAEAAVELKKKQRAAARKEALLKATQELEREARLAEQRGTAKGDLVDVYIDLAPAVCVGKAKHLMPPAIVLDGRHFIHGTTQRVPRKVAAVLMEQVQRSWQHNASISGQHDENAYRRHQILDPRKDPRVAGIA